MKKLFKVALIALCILTAGNLAKAQSKIGYINFQAVVSQMPEAKTIKAQLDIYSKQFTDELSAMNTEYQSKVKAYQAGLATMTDATRTAKETELQDLQKRMSDYNTTAQQKFDEKTNELSKPLIDKVRAAINEAAKEKGYNYVFDTGSTQLLVLPDADDLMVPVKTKLGLK
jgi:outer membrane protein